MKQMGQKILDKSRAAMLLHQNATAPEAEMEKNNSFSSSQSSKSKSSMRIREITAGSTALKPSNF